MSKKTVYQVFSAKSELFDALLTDWLAPLTLPIEADGRPPRQVLTELLIRLVTFVLDEHQIAMTRLLIAETLSSEELAEALRRQGLGKGRGALDQWLAREVARNTLRVDDIGETADMLFFTAAGDFMLGLLLRTRTHPTACAIAKRVERAVTTFFQMHQ